MGKCYSICSRWRAVFKPETVTDGPSKPVYRNSDPLPRPPEKPETGKFHPLPPSTPPRHVLRLFLIQGSHEPYSSFTREVSLPLTSVRHLHLSYGLVTPVSIPVLVNHREWRPLISGVLSSAYAPRVRVKRVNWLLSSKRYHDPMSGYRHVSRGEKKMY